MPTTFQFSCVITPTNPVVPIGLEVWLDGDKIFDQDHVSKAEIFRKDFSDQDGEHVLQFVLKNKLPEHTIIDNNGEIFDDARIVINDILFEEINVTHVVNSLAKYQHDFNGNGPVIQDEFYGDIGCNGTVTLKFSTPIYLWLLENM
jgi:hypothetical protein